MSPNCTPSDLVRRVCPSIPRVKHHQIPLYIKNVLDCKNRYCDRYLVGLGKETFPWNIQTPAEHEDRDSKQLSSYSSSHSRITSFWVFVTQKRRVSRTMIWNSTLQSTMSLSCPWICQILRACSPLPSKHSLDWVEGHWTIFSSLRALLTALMDPDLMARNGANLTW